MKFFVTIIKKYGKPPFKVLGALWVGGCVISSAPSPSVLSPLASSSFLAKKPSSRTLPTVRKPLPYMVKNVLYIPQENYSLNEVGLASYYGGEDKCHGLPTATGEKFDMFHLTAAHRTLPIPCVARVTNLENGRSIIVKINDRGPYKKDRILDVSMCVAEILGFYKKGTARVRVEGLPQESMALVRSIQQFKKQRTLVALGVAPSPKILPSQPARTKRPLKTFPVEKKMTSSPVFSSSPPAFNTVFHLMKKITQKTP